MVVVEVAQVGHTVLFQSSLLVVLAEEVASTTLVEAGLLGRQALPRRRARLATLARWRAVALVVVVAEPRSQQPQQALQVEQEALVEVVVEVVGLE